MRIAEVCKSVRYLCTWAPRHQVFPYLWRNRLGQWKYIVRWLLSMQGDYLLMNGIPWFTFGAIDYISSRVHSGTKVFEYGSGGSTIFWLNRGAKVVSIEHDQSWYSRMLSSHSKGLLDYRFIPPERSGFHQGGASDPDAYVSSGDKYSRNTFQCYCKQIDEFDDGFFDVVLIDGRARPSCIKHSVSKVKRGGLLVLDDSFRLHYTEEMGEHLRNFVRKRFVGVVPGTIQIGETTVFIRET